MAKRIVAQEPWIAPDFYPETFGRLTTVSSVYKPEGSKHALQDFVCACGNKVTKPRVNVVHNNCSSCGCLKRDLMAARNKASAKHGYFGTPTYRSWEAMIARCEDTSHMAYHNYGGRGITIDPILREFTGFLAVLGPRPSLEYSIDRHPNKDGNYEPGNVRWATRKEQLRNTRVNVIIEYQGKTQCASAWAEELGIPVGRIYDRLESGWPIEDTFTVPPRSKRPPKGPLV